MSVPATWNVAELPQWIWIKPNQKPYPPKPENPITKHTEIGRRLKSDIKPVEVKLVQIHAVLKYYWCINYV